MFTISNPAAYCPLLTCGVAGGRHNSPSLHNVEHDSLGKLTYQLDLVYLAQPFTVECSNSHDKDTKTSSNDITIEIHCPVSLGCSNTDVGTFDWPRYALISTRGVWFWREFVPASLHTTTPDWRNLWNSNGFTSRDRNYHEFEIRNGQWPVMEFEKFRHMTCSYNCHAYHQYEVLEID